MKRTTHDLRSTTRREELNDFRPARKRFAVKKKLNTQDDALHRKRLAVKQKKANNSRNAKKTKNMKKTTETAKT